MFLNRFTPEYRLKPWIKRTGTTADFSSSRRSFKKSYPYGRGVICATPSREETGGTENGSYVNYDHALRRGSDGWQDGSDVDVSVVGWDRHIVNFSGVRHLDFLVVWPSYIVIEHFAVNAGDGKGDRECPLRIGEIEEDQRNLLRFRCCSGSPAPVGDRTAAKVGVCVEVE